MKDRTIDTLIWVLFLAVIAFVACCMFSVMWSAVELHGIHHELQVLNDSLNWYHYE